MLERIGGLITFHCDECSDCVETGTNALSDAVIIMKEEGWANVREPKTGEFTHVCPACLES